MSQHLEPVTTIVLPITMASLPDRRKRYSIEDALDITASAFHPGASARDSNGFTETREQHRRQLEMAACAIREADRVPVLNAIEGQLPGPPNDCSLRRDDLQHFARKYLRLELNLPDDDGAQHRADEAWLATRGKDGATLRIDVPEALKYIELMTLRAELAGSLWVLSNCSERQQTLAFSAASEMVREACRVGDLTPVHRVTKSPLDSLVITRWTGPGLPWEWTEADIRAAADIDEVQRWLTVQSVELRKIAIDMKGWDYHGDGPVYWTIRNASFLIGEAQQWSEETRRQFVRDASDAADTGELVVINPSTLITYRPKHTRDFWDFVTTQTMNAWLEKRMAPYRWSTKASPDSAGNDDESHEVADCERRIGGRKLWRLSRALAVLVAMPGIGITMEAFKGRVVKAAAARPPKIVLRDPNDGDERPGDQLSGFFDDWLFASDMNSWLQAEMFAETYRLPHDEVAKSAAVQEELAVTRAAMHAARILKALVELGFDPIKLPRTAIGNPSRAKQAAREALVRNKAGAMSKAVFDRAWQSLRQSKEIGEE